jgi:hypothetical protein
MTYQLVLPQSQICGRWCTGFHRIPATVRVGIRIG